MEKVYLLLRNNRQTGPYTYEELLQHQLLPTDLIWVEGKSAAWMSPAELAGQRVPAASPRASERAQRPAAPPAASPQIPWYVNRKSPEAELEERAQALRQRVQEAAVPAVHHSSAATTPHRNRQRTVYQEEEQPLLLEIHTVSKKSVTLPQLIAAGVITALVAAGWYNREVLQVVRPQPDTVTQAAAPAIFRVNLPPPPQPKAVAAADTTVQAKDSVAMEVVLTPPASQPKPVKKAVKETVILTTEPIIVEPPVMQPSTTTKKEDSAKASQAAETKDTAEPPAVQAGTEAALEEPTPQKKRGLGQTLKKIFKKKKKNEDKEDSDNNDPE